MTNFKTSALLGAAAIALISAAPAIAAPVKACLITKTESNPYFVKMKQGAKAEAKKLGVELKTYAGKYDGDNESQVNAIEACMADGAKGILITASSTKAIVPSVEKARKAGLLVIARNSSFVFKGQAVDVKEVSRKLEKKLAENPAVEHVRSDNREGMSVVFVDLYDTTKVEDFKLIRWALPGEHAAEGPPPEYAPL